MSGRGKGKGARLYWRARRGRPGVWVILDTGKPERSTGTQDRRQAEIALSDYITQQRRVTAGPTTPDNLTVADALAIYGEEHAPDTTDPQRIGYAIDALLDFWGELPVSSITGATCRRYARSRVHMTIDRATGQKVPTDRPIAQGTVRRELGALQAALNHCQAEGHLTHAPTVTLPEKPPAKDRWLTASEAASLLRLARGKRRRHLTRFLLLGLYTGTRKEAILTLRWQPHLAGGWIDVDNGIIYRSAAEAVQTKKRRRPVKMPAKLIAHCRRWRDLDRQASEDAENPASYGWVVNVSGARVGSIKTAWNTLRRDAGVPDVTPHTLKHTAITWAMQRGVDLNDAASFFSTSRDTLERVYWHHHPDFQAATAAAMDRKRP